MIGHHLVSEQMWCHFQSTVTLAVKTNWIVLGMRFLHLPLEEAHMLDFGNQCFMIIFQPCILFFPACKFICSLLIVKVSSDYVYNSLKLITRAERGMFCAIYHLSDNGTTWNFPTPKIIFYILRKPGSWQLTTANKQIQCEGGFFFSTPITRSSQRPPYL